MLEIKKEHHTQIVESLLAFEKEFEKLYLQIPVQQWTPRHRSEEEKQAKEKARTEALFHCETDLRSIITKNLQKANTRGTYEEALASMFKSGVSNACKRIYQKHSSALASSAPISKKYKTLCEWATNKEGRIVPPDSTISILLDCSPDVVGSSRARMKSKGWVFNSVTYPGTGGKAYEVQSPPPQMTDDELLTLETLLKKAKAAGLV
jgi:hypothetical protein